jgi:hypothetical protein
MSLHCESLFPPLAKGGWGDFLIQVNLLKQDVMVILGINQETSSLVNFKKWVAQEIQGS